MATEYVLAKRDYFNSLLQRRENNVQETSPSPSTPPPSLHTPKEPSDDLAKHFDQLISFMPKTYRKRTIAFVELFRSKIFATDNNRLVFKHGGQEYENLTDLLFWLFTHNHMIRTLRPTNAFDFIQTLVELNVPARFLTSKGKYVQKIRKSVTKYRKKRKSRR